MYILFILILIYLLIIVFVMINISISISHAITIITNQLLYEFHNRNCIYYDKDMNLSYFINNISSNLIIINLYYIFKFNKYILYIQI